MQSVVGAAHCIVGHDGVEKKGGGGIHSAVDCEVFGHVPHKALQAWLRWPRQHEIGHAPVGQHPRPVTEDLVRQGGALAQPGRRAVAGRAVW